MQHVTEVTYASVVFKRYLAYLCIHWPYLIGVWLIKMIKLNQSQD